MKREYTVKELYEIKEDWDYDYPTCLLKAAQEMGMTNLNVIVVNARPTYHGIMDMVLTANNGQDIMFYLRQDYGSCSVCDWLERSGSREVIEEYKKQIKHFLEELC